MILIISENSDYNTDVVIDWLSYKGKAFCRVNNTDLFNIEHIEINDSTASIELSSANIRLNLKTVKTYWHRRGELNFVNGEKGIKNINNNGIEAYLNSEFKFLKKFVLDFLYTKNGVGKISENFTNKISNLFFAKQFGLKIPATYILNSKDSLDKLSESNDLITKGIQRSYYTSNGFEFTLLTSEVNHKDLYKLYENINHSLVQTKLRKRYELRVFYFDGFFFTIAIFSQNDKQTSIDFRNYNYIKPNRTPPFELPNEIQHKLIKLMKYLKMKSGSIDIVVTENNDYVFLEVNPFGQFNQVSKPANYYIEKYISEYLINIDK
jgi:ATP-GRASP peptide maturase of grasp-with-spasm system